jgi:hypothetical protein
MSPKKAGTQKTPNHTGPLSVQNNAGKPLSVNSQIEGASEGIPNENSRKVLS